MTIARSFLPGVALTLLSLPAFAQRPAGAGTPPAETPAPAAPAPPSPFSAVQPALPGSGTAPLPPAATLSVDPSLDYVIEPGDVIEISVFNHVEFSQVVTVPPDGKMTYPYAGDIKIDGLSLAALKKRVTQVLSSQLQRPQVSVYLRQRPMKLVQVSVLGAVRAPGKRVLKKGWKIFDVIADCGGLAVDRPEWVTATLVKGSGADMVPVSMSRLLSPDGKGVADEKENLPLEEGDVLIVQALDVSQIQVQVLGEVGRPGPVAVPRDGSVRDTIMAAGGTSPRAALSRATILRGNQTIPLDLSGLKTDGRVGEGIKLTAGDVIVVPVNKLWYAVFGSVGRPGYQDYPEDEKLSLVKALSLLGGTAPNADLKNVTLIRPSKKQGENPQIIALNLEDMMKKRKTLPTDVIIEPEDVLFVPFNDPKRRFDIREIFSFLPFYSLIRGRY